MPVNRVTPRESAGRLPSFYVLLSILISFRGVKEDNDDSDSDSDDDNESDSDSDSDKYYTFHLP